MGYLDNPIEAIDKQIQKAALSGHDIQLHIHTQWYKAKYINNKWVVDFTNYRLGEFKNDDNGYSVEDLIRECNESLKEIIKQVLPDYKCIGLRAGDYNIILSDKVYHAMKLLNMKYDSSIYPGGYETGNLSKYDYRIVPNNLDYWWADSNDIREKSDVNKVILEIPIFTLQISWWRYLFTVPKIKSLISNRKKSISAVSLDKIANKGFLEKFKLLFQLKSTTWDVCVFSNFLHKKYFKHIENKIADKRKNYVLIGHPKSLQDIKLFENFITIKKTQS